MRAAKNLFTAALFVSLALPVSAKSLSGNYSAISNDSKIIQSLNAMDGTSATWARKAIMGDNASGKPVIIEFKNLAEINQEYTNFDALGWKKGTQLYIYINNKHRNAPPEALASTLSHEAVHQDDKCSLEEETYAWGYEADVWLQMLKKNPQLAQIKCPLTDRLNTIGKLFKTANYTTESIRNVVYTNPGYQGFPVHSPGF